MNGPPSEQGADPERTILVPQPGRRGAPARPPAAPLPPNAAAALPQGGNGHGLNPLVAAANPLLNLVIPLRVLPHHPHPEQLRQQLSDALRAFERQARTAGVGHEALAAARYALCTLIDETVSATPWGGSGVWAHHSLLVSFHNEASGGEKFFIVLQKLCQDPRANIDAIELMYVCLMLGLEGRYRVLENGAAQLEVLRDRLQMLIARERGTPEPGLSVHWQGARGQGQPLWQVLPVWVAAAVVVAVLVLLQIGLNLRLSGRSTPVYERLALVVLPVLAAPPPAPPAPPRPQGLAQFLAADIAAGRVSVSEEPDRTMVTLNGNRMFASGSAEVEGDFVGLLERIGDALRTVPGAVKVIGHTDNTTGFSAQYPSNWELSKGRAARVAALLAARTGAPQRFSVEGRGEREPVAPNDSNENRARNRRVVIAVLAPSTS